MKHFLLLSLSTATIFLMASLNLNRLPGSAALADRLPNSPIRPIPKFQNSIKKFWLEASPVFYRNETIDLHFAAPNAPFLGVVDPSGHFFYLVYPIESATGGLKPVVESDLFIEMTSLKINTRSFKADPYQYGVSTNQPVFTKSGKYTFILGENLHVDNPDELAQVVVEYIHASRPAQIQPAVAMN